MRVYEFARQHNISVKEVLQRLRDGGYDVKSHMVMLDQKALNFLTKPNAKKIVGIKKKTSEIKKPATSKEIIVKEKEILPHPKKLPVEEPEELSQQKEIVLSAMSLVDFAEKVERPVNELIVTLLKMGVVVTKNQLLKEDIVSSLAKQLDVRIKKPVAEKERAPKGIVVKEGVFRDRSPVIVVLGHVDHGKTTLLDYIRKTRVATREKGGITQHLGAYVVTTKLGRIVFLDTPGHEAFYKMRGRGAGVADMAVLVVAADDGIMPQTIEAIKHAKAAAIPIIVAINKLDKVDASRVATVKQSLMQYDLLPEEWGGDIIVVPISAKFGQGIDQLLEMIVLKSQLMELKADVAGPAKGYVLESKPEKGRGPVGTILCQHGRLKVGDYFVCGTTTGKVNSLIDSLGRRVKEVEPCVPVQVAGFSSLPEVGDFFEVIPESEYRKMRAWGVEQKRVQRPLVEGALNLIIKADTNSSKEALLGAITKLGHSLEREFNIINSAVGDVTESDVILAMNTNSIIFAFNIKIEHNALLLAQHSDVIIHVFDVIYKLLDKLKELAEKGKEVEKVLVKIGDAVVRKVFDIKGIGVIAGCYVREGRISRDGIVTIWRGKQKIGSGKISSLQRERKTVKEVHTGFECGFIINGFTDWAIDDNVECFLEMPKAEKK